MKYPVFVLALLLTCRIVVAQPLPANDHYVSYTVNQGETIFSISRAFNLSQEDLIAANPSLKAGLRTGQQLQIPSNPKAQVQEELPSFYTYKVKRGNTLHYIAKRFGVTVEDILKYNPEAERGIQKGDKLRIPDKNDLVRIKKQAEQAAPQKEEKVVVTTITHTVQPGETLYGISRKYQVPIADVLRLNPDAGRGLGVGMELKIPASHASAEAGTQQPADLSQGVSPDSFFVHLVESGETFWSLERKYHTSRNELEAYNPVLKEGLKSGLRIRIPYKSVPEFQVVPKNDSAFDKHTVQHGETVYGIARQFNVSIAELKQVNPVLEFRGLVEGETILIPKAEKQFVVSTPESPSQDVYDDNVDEEKYRYSLEFSSEDMPAVCQPNPAARFEQYNVALLLPLYLPANDTINRVKVLPDPDSPDYESELVLMADSFTVRPDRIVYPRSESFLQFYEGVLLAVDSLKKSGMNIKLHVFDTDQSAAKVQSVLYSAAFASVDLIIGPVFPELQGPVADYAKMKGIPMISPLSSSGNLEQTNPYYFKINPTKEYLIQKTADYIADEYFDKNLVVLSTGNYQNLPEAKLVDLTREKFFLSPYRNEGQRVLFHDYNLQREGALGLSRILTEDQENVVIIPSETEAQVSVAITNLNAAAENYPITLIGSSNFQRYKSIQTEYFHHVKMNVLSPYYVDYKSPVVNEFIRKFRRNFADEPSQFSFQGYDIAYYFMSALFNYGKDFVGCLPYHHVNLTQGEFYFEKVNRSGGYMNQGLFILKYEPDYTIRLKGTTGKSLYQISENK
ncbi:LysM peptidoglycan-binding domain-containing protein [Mangrovibacterium lignilyticum]|uniref:LysM peptidoglycan-binding domain-containing protein n=1 Tax=Mangrovibacterium lignilyticum TaxID=2668052 RepID=UPI0013CF9433|nr:LysM peptidoglycan-binding domain-containing protein [Mangrovibacterium lignilyticum]